MKCQRLYQPKDDRPIGFAFPWLIAVLSTFSQLGVAAVQPIDICGVGDVFAMDLHTIAEHYRLVPVYEERGIMSADDLEDLYDEWKTSKKGQ